MRACIATSAASGCATAGSTPGPFQCFGVCDTTPRAYIFAATKLGLEPFYGARARDSVRVVRARVCESAR